MTRAGVKDDLLTVATIALIGGAVVAGPIAVASALRGLGPSIWLVPIAVYGVFGLIVISIYSLTRRKIDGQWPFTNVRYQRGESR